MQRGANVACLEIEFHKFFLATLSDDERLPAGRETASHAEPRRRGEGRWD